VNAVNAMRPLALTLGEPAGIGPDLALLLWTRRDALAVPPFLLVGDPASLAARARLLRLQVRVAESEADGAGGRFATALPVMPTGIAATAAPGKPDATSAPSARAAIDRAVALVRSGKACALVTNPIAKAAMYRAGFDFPGHTEYLAHLCAAPGGRPPRPVMLIWCEELAVVPVTIHVPLAEVARLLTVDLIVETGRIVARELERRFGVARPRLALCGLNPHAGEGGALGREDEEVVRPAVERLQAEGIAASGPHAADTLFHPAARARYDAALGMYHDQVLAPIKTIAFERAVNVTLGLPFVRTSPDHGTAFELAGTGKADPSSLNAALKLARRLADAGAKSPATAK
jgi:4-hydroxythreonine-4-phosphate dehydrogenase